MAENAFAACQYPMPITNYIPMIKIQVQGRQKKIWVEYLPLNCPVEASSCGRIVLMAFWEMEIRSDVGLVLLNF